MPEKLLAAMKVDANDPAFLYLNLHPDEEIKYIVRHHWAGFLGTLGIVFAMALFPLLILLTANLALGNNLGEYTMIIAAIVSSFYIFLLTFLFGSWINYYYDILFITTERIINVSQEGLLARQTSELSLDEIQNVTADVSGFLPSLFDYGILVVETAGGGTSDNPHHAGLQGYFTIKDTPNPNLLARVILELHRKDENNNP